MKNADSCDVVGGKCGRGGWFMLCCIVLCCVVLWCCVASASLPCCRLLPRCYACMPTTGLPEGLESGGLFSLLSCDVVVSSYSCPHCVSEILCEAKFLILVLDGEGREAVPPHPERRQKRVMIGTASGPRSSSHRRTRSPISALPASPLAPELPSTPPCWRSQLPSLLPTPLPPPPLLRVPPSAGPRPPLMVGSLPILNPNALRP